MEQQEFKRQFIRTEVSIDDTFGIVHAYIEFGNVAYWFSEDRQDQDRNVLPDNQMLAIDIERLKFFSDSIASDTRFYYGHPDNDIRFLTKAKYIFGKHRVPTKRIRYVRHYLTSAEVSINTRELLQDKKGVYVLVPKCNFDVEIAVDAMRNIEKYETFCLFSSDADFVHLARFLKAKGKKFILVKGGFIDQSLRAEADLIINAQDIKKHIAFIKQKPGTGPGFADLEPVSTGR